MYLFRLRAYGNKVNGNITHIIKKHSIRHPAQLNSRFDEFHVGLDLTGLCTSQPVNIQSAVGYRAFFRVHWHCGQS